MNISTVFQPGWKWCGIALLCGGLLGALAGWWVTDNKFTADIATLKQQYAKDIKAISDEASAQRDKTQRRNTHSQALLPKATRSIRRS